MYLYGKNSVLERLKANPKSIKRIFLQHNFNAGSVLKAIDETHIPVKRVTEKDLNCLKRADRLQGIVAEVEKFRYTPLENILKDKTSQQRLSLVCLDNINDPHNLGSIMRITACFGRFAVVIPTHSSCEVNDTVMHVASGGENFTPVCKVVNLSRALIEAKNAGYWVVGTVIKDGKNLHKENLPFPLCLVLGSEGKGIRYGVEKHLDLKVTLPMKGVSLSFNVAMACAIFCYEIDKQRKNIKG